MCMTLFTRMHVHPRHLSPTFDHAVGILDLDKPVTVLGERHGERNERKVWLDLAIRLNECELIGS